MSTDTADQHDVALPGIGVPPPGYTPAYVSPRQMAAGDLLLLGGLVRAVRYVAFGTRTGRPVIRLDPADRAESDVWLPLTGELPIPIWRTEAQTARQVLKDPQRPDLLLLERVLDGLRALSDQPRPGLTVQPPAVAAAGIESHRPVPQMAGTP